MAIIKQYWILLPVKNRDSDGSRCVLILVKIKQFIVPYNGVHACLAQLSPGAQHVTCNATKLNTGLKIKNLCPKPVQNQDSFRTNPRDYTRRKVDQLSCNLEKEGKCFFFFQLENSYSRIGGVWRVYSSIGQQNSAEIALVYVKGSRVPAAHPHPENP